MTQAEFQERYIYDLTRDCLGRGGFGAVYRAHDTVRGREVAIKISEVKDEHLRLRNEVDIAKSIPEHRNIAFYEECYTIPMISGICDFAIMQYYESGSLDHLLTHEQLSLEQKYDILLQILNGIDFLHSHNIIHRDLKPQNILIDRYKDKITIKITDFGISKYLSNGDNAYTCNSIMGAGTLSYSSPEQLTERNIQRNTDLWSFGVLAFRMLTNSLPFSCDNDINENEDTRSQLIQHIKSGILPPAIDSIAEPWQTLIRKCLITNNSLRVKDVNECYMIVAPSRVKAKNVYKLSDEQKPKDEITKPTEIPPKPVKAKTKPANIKPIQPIAQKVNTPPKQLNKPSKQSKFRAKDSLTRWYRIATISFFVVGLFLSIWQYFDTNILHTENFIGMGLGLVSIIISRFICKFDERSLWYAVQALLILSVVLVVTSIFDTSSKTICIMLSYCLPTLLVGLCLSVYSIIESFKDQHISDGRLRPWERVIYHIPILGTIGTIIWCSSCGMDITSYTLFILGFVFTLLTFIVIAINDYKYKCDYSIIVIWSFVYLFVYGEFIFFLAIIEGIFDFDIGYAKNFYTRIIVFSPIITSAFNGILIPLVNAITNKLK